jgi:hypothetical protein
VFPDPRPEALPEPLPALHVLFTLDVPAAGPRAAPYGPAGWEVSARTIDAFCTTLLSAGFAPTLFVSPEAVEQHGPLCQDFASAGAEVALLVQPPTLRGASLKHLLGAYGREAQEAIIGESRQRFAEAFGRRPLSMRSAWYSANDHTYPAATAVGLRQASISSPGRRIAKHYASWDGAPTEAHFASASSRLEAGDLPLLEVPVTTDASQRRDGVAPDLAIENGTVERWHAPLIQAHLARLEAQGAVFRTLCFVTTTRHAYHDPTTRQRQTLDALLDHLREVEAHYTLVPATLAEMPGHFRAARAARAAADGRSGRNGVLGSRDEAGATTMIDGEAQQR